MKKKTAGAHLLLAGVLALGFVSPAQAAPTTDLTQVINAGTLVTDILDASRVAVTSPSVAMSAKNFSFTCQSGGSASTGLFGTNTQRIYVTNPGAANNGWTLTLAATSGATARWQNTGATSFIDFNDAGTGGCADSGDTDTTGGQLTVDPSVSTLTTDCTSCTTTGVTKGSSTAYVEGTTNSVTLLNAGASSEDNWRGYLTGASMSQVIPAETVATSYTLNLTLTSTAL